MQPVEFEEVTNVIAKNQPEYNPLPAYRSPDGTLTFCWKLTWKERVKLLLTGRIWHSVMTFNTPLQPQMLGVDKPPMGQEQTDND